MSTSTPTPSAVGDPTQAPFDPRRESRAIPPPPPQPSEWLDPVFLHEPGVPIEGGSDDESVVIVDDEEPPLEEDAEEEPAEDPIDPVTGATPATIAGRRAGQSPARRRLVTPTEQAALQTTFTPEQRLLILDAWKRSGLPAGDFAPLVNLSKHTLYGWKNRFEQEGPAGLMERRHGGPKGSRLSEATKRAIIMMKESNPEWGIERIADMLARGPGLGASPNAIGAVLRGWGCEIVERPTTPHRDHKRRFERERANELWQSDLFTFMLKRQNQRVHLVAFIDDHSRFIVSFGLHASQSTALVLEIFRAGIASYGPPEEMLTDNGSQYVTWRGKSAFAHECDNAAPVEVTLAAAAPGAAPATPLPQPQTPQGVPVSPWGSGADGPHPPGVSPIDDLQALPASLRSGGAPWSRPCPSWSRHRRPQRRRHHHRGRRNASCPAPASRPPSAWPRPPSGPGRWRHWCWTCWAAIALRLTPPRLWGCRWPASM